MSDEAITVFKHEQFGGVRVTDQDGEPWFYAKDVAVALGYTDTDQAVRKHCKRARMFNDFNPVKTTGLKSLNIPGPKIIPESDVYRLVMRSKLEGAERFQTWVCEEVLPSIRKTGAYISPHLDPDRLLMGHKAAIELLEFMHQRGLVGDTFVKRYVEHSLAVVSGTVVQGGDRVVDVSTFLSGKGLTASRLRRWAPLFGKALKLSYIEKHGEAPERAMRFVNGADRQVYCYTERDLQLFEDVYEELFDGVE